MRKVLSLSLFATAYCLATSPAWAAWSSFLTMGSTVVVADASCATPKSGQIVCAVRSLQNTLVVNIFNGTKWTGWTALPGVATAVTSNPGCADDGAGKVICGARGATSALVATVFNGTAFGSLTTAGGQITSAPSCAALSAGKVVCVARSASGGLTSSVFNGTAWSAFASITTPAYSAPGCAPDRAGNAICLFLTNTSAVLAARYNGTSWTPAINIGGRASGEPICTEFGVAGKVACFARGTDTALWGIQFNGGTWSTAGWSLWGSLGGLVESKASCALLVGPSQIVCGVQGTVDGALYGNQYNGTTWLGWVRVGGTILGTPACTKLASGKALCAVTGVNNQGSSATGP